MNIAWEFVVGIVAAALVFITLIVNINEYSLQSNTQETEIRKACIDARGVYIRDGSTGHCIVNGGTK